MMLLGEMLVNVSVCVIMRFGVVDIGLRLLGLFMCL